MHMARPDGTYSVTDWVHISWQYYSILVFTGMKYITSVYIHVILFVCTPINMYTVKGSDHYLA